MWISSRTLLKVQVKVTKGFALYRNAIIAKKWFSKRHFQEVNCYSRFFHETEHCYGVTLFAELAVPLLTLAKPIWWFLVLARLLVGLVLPLVVLVFSFVVLVFSPHSTHLFTRSTRLFICLSTRSTLLSFCSICLSTRSIWLSTRSARSTICPSFCNWSIFTDIFRNNGGCVRLNHELQYGFVDKSMQNKRI